jgi:hypothetical protein
MGNIEQLNEQKAKLLSEGFKEYFKSEEVKILPSAEEYFYKEFNTSKYPFGLGNEEFIKIMESFASLAVEHEQELCNERLDELSAHYETKIVEAVEQARKEWEKERTKLILNGKSAGQGQQNVID